MICSAELEVEPNVPFKLVARPLASVPAMPSEPGSDLNNDACSPKLAVEPIDVLKLTPRPLNSDDASPNEPEKDLNRAA